MKDHLIKAINTFSNLYPDHLIEFIYLWTVNDNIVTYRITGIKDDSKITDMIKVDL